MKHPGASSRTRRQADFGRLSNCPQLIYRKRPGKGDTHRLGAFTETLGKRAGRRKFRKTSCETPHGRLRREGYSRTLVRAGRSSSTPLPRPPAPLPTTRSRADCRGPQVPLVDVTTDKDPPRKSTGHFPIAKRRRKTRSKPSSEPPYQKIMFKITNTTATTPAQKIGRS